MDKSKLKLSLLLAMIALPIGLATFSFYFYQGQGVNATTNNGTLITPVIDITAFTMEDENGSALFQSFEIMVEGIDAEDYVPRPWAMIFLGSNTCDVSCGDRLFYLRQLHRLLGSDEERLARYYVNAGASRELDANTQSMFNEAFAGLKLAYSQRDILLSNLAFILPDEVDPILEHYIFLADPLGNVMMYFTPENTPDDILEDLEKLLDQSSLG